MQHSTIAQEVGWLRRWRLLAKNRHCSHERDCECNRLFSSTSLGKAAQIVLEAVVLRPDEPDIAMVAEPGVGQFREVQRLGGTLGCVLM